MSQKVTTAQRRSRANRGFSAIVFFSLFIHSVAIAGALYSQHRRPQVLDMPNSIPVQLVALGKKRDPELLPRKIEEVPTPPPPTEGVALDTGKEEPTPPKTDEEKPEKKKSDQKLSAAARRLLEGSDSKLEQALDKIPEREGDPEGDVRGTTTDSANAAAGYQRTIIKTLQSNYRLPETIPASQRQFLKAEVLLFIERDGRIAEFEFKKEHTNEIFMGALKAMLSALRLPPPPPSEAKNFKENGVLVIFRP